MKTSLIIILLMLSLSLAAQDENKSADSVFADHASRYQFAPTGFGLNKGNVYLNTAYYLLYDIQYGVSDNFSIGLGGPVVPFFMYLTPKISIGSENEKSNIAIGAVLGGQTIGEFLGYSFALPYLIYTAGSPTRNISFGAGYTYGDIEGLVFNSGFILPISSNNRSAQFLTEVWIIPDAKIAVIAPGIRLFDKDSNDYWGGGLTFTVIDGSTFPFPTVFRTILF